MSTGSWVTQPFVGLRQLAYRCFLPSALYRRGALLKETKLMLDWLGYWTVYRGLFSRRHEAGQPDTPGRN